MSTPHILQDTITSFLFLLPIDFVFKSFARTNPNQARVHYSENLLA